MKYLFLILLLLSGSALADDAEARLKSALKRMDSVSAEFKQTLRDEDKNIVQQSRGTVDLQRPGKFAWIYLEPYEQHIVADGNELWIYDVDLDQVTVKPMDSGLAAAPIMILMKEADVTEQFNVNEVGQRKYLYWVELEPRESGLEYTHIYLGIEDDSVRAMELRDQFGRSTQIVFENLRVGVIHDPAKFDFRPPPGVDVYGVGG
jgi:outer membrane lipoprotein carrier protein